MKAFAAALLLVSLPGCSSPKMPGAKNGSQDHVVPMRAADR